MVRLTRLVSSSRLFHLRALALGAAWASIATVMAFGVAGACAYKTISGARARVSIGTGISVRGAGLRFERSLPAENQIAVPEARALAVVEPQRRYVAVVQEFTVVTQELNNSTVERNAYRLVSSRFAALISGRDGEDEQIARSLAPEGISLASTGQRGDFEYSEHLVLTARASLARVLRGESERSLKVATPVASRRAMNNQASAKLATHNPTLSVVKTESTTVKRPLLAYNEASSDDQLGYSSDMDQPVKLRRLRLDEGSTRAIVHEGKHASRPSVANKVMPTQASALAALAKPSAVDRQAPIDSTIIMGGVVTQVPLGYSNPLATQAPLGSAQSMKEDTAGQRQHKAQEQQRSALSVEAASALMAFDGTTMASTKQVSPAIFSGAVVEAFSSTHSPVSEATVQVLGTQLSVRTDALGRFSFNGVSVEGVLPVVVQKDGYFRRRIDLRALVPAGIELASVSAVDHTATALDEKVTGDGAFVFGQLTSPLADTVEGMKVDVVGASSAAVVYLDDKGLPDRQASFTSRRGQFVLLNAKPGTYLLAITDKHGVERAPHVIHVDHNEGLVRRFSVGEPRVVRGRILNAMASSAPVGGATVQLLGLSKFAVTSNAKGEREGTFELGPVYVDCSETNYVQIDKPGFYRNRIDYACDQSGTARPFYVVSKSYVDGLALDSRTTLDAVTGAVVGHVGFSGSVKMQLWGPSELSPTAAPRGKDYYVGGDGVLDPELNRTTKNGNFSILQAPAGLSYIQAFSRDNKTLSFWPILLSESTVNVYAQ